MGIEQDNGPRGTDPQAAVDWAENDATDFTSLVGEQRRGMRLALLAQVFGMLADFAFRNGILLVYLRALGLPGDRVLLYLSLPPVIMFFLRLPAAHAADRLGLKRLGVPGFRLIPLAFLLFAAAGSFVGAWREALVATGAVVHGVGITLGSVGLTPLLRRIVPRKLRGRYFGKLNAAWQSVGLVFVAACALLLPAEVPVPVYQGILGIMILGGAVRAFLFARIAEPPAPSPPTAGFGESVLQALRAPGFASFSAYVFLIALSTGAAPYVFGLLEREVLGFGDNLVVWMGNLIMVGSLAGFFLGGKGTDRFGTKPVFLICHFGYSLALAVLIARAVLPLPVVALATVANVLYGFCWAASLIAITTELYALVPRRNQALGIAVPLLLFHFGGSVAGLLASGALRVGMLENEWHLFGTRMSQYDTLLLAGAVLVILLVITLGLVPSVLRKTEWSSET